jgi:hypothetical protein
LVVAFRVARHGPLVIAANREEAYDRGGSLPHIVGGPVAALAGLDPLAGGTWLGVNEHGVVVAVTNRAKSQPPPRARSRGLLARDLLACQTAAQAADLGTSLLDQDPYAGCNLLCADSESAYAIHAGDLLQVRPLPPGVHVLTNRDVNDLGEPRSAYALARLSGAELGTAQHCIESLQGLCTQCGADGPPICVRGSKAGTVSSTIVVLTDPPDRSLYLHAQGPPDQTPYQDYSHLLRHLLAHSRIKVH